MARGMARLDLPMSEGGRPSVPGGMPAARLLEMSSALLHHAAAGRAKV